MASVYTLSGPPGDGRKGMQNLGYLPLRMSLKDGTAVEIGFFEFDSDDFDQGHQHLNKVIEDGLYWPYWDGFDTVDGFRSYFCSDTALRVRELRTVNGREQRSDFLGAFYVKPNFPDRCGHFCNGGFLTVPKARGRGVATAMGEVFLRVAKDVGFRAAYFNLVFVSNQASIRVWEKLGFTALARVPGVAALRGLPGYTDAIQFYYDLTKFDHRTYKTGRSLALRQVPTGIKDHKGWGGSGGQERAVAASLVMALLAVCAGMLWKQQS